MVNAAARPVQFPLGQYSDTGADLWRKYDAAPIPFDYKKR